MHSLLYEAARDYVARGWSVIPLIGKKPAIKWEPFQERRANEKLIHKWFSKKSITGIGIIGGQVSGHLAVRDFDSAEAYDDWRATYPEDAASLPTAKTARGYHVYGNHDVEIFFDFANGEGELRGDSRHYVVAPPSKHPEGAEYIWIQPLPPVGISLPILPKSLIPSSPSVPPHSSTQVPTACVNSHKLVSTEEAIRDAIKRYQPFCAGERRDSCLFPLARRLKAICPGASEHELKKIVYEWYRKALPIIKSKDFDETWDDFTDAWRNVKWPLYDQSFKQAKRDMADHEPEACKKYDDENILKIIRLCCQLQRQWGDKPFFLSCRKAGNEIGISHELANQHLRTLRDAKPPILKEMDKGPSGKKSRIASTWRFIDLASE